MVCRKQLSTGEELYVLDENKFICKDDYLKSNYTGEFFWKFQVVNKKNDFIFNKTYTYKVNRKYKS